jgi:hypothetical protein
MNGTVSLMQTAKRLNDGNGAATLSCMQDCGWWWLTVTLRLRMADDGCVTHDVLRSYCCGAEQARMSNGCVMTTVRIG